MKDISDRTKAIVAVLLTAIAGGGIPVLGKIGFKVIPPFTFTFLRFFLASIFITPLFLKNKPKFGKDIWKLILLSMLAIY